MEKDCSLIAYVGIDLLALTRLCMVLDIAHWERLHTLYSIASKTLMLRYAEVVSMEHCALNKTSFDGDTFSH